MYGLPLHSITSSMPVLLEVVLVRGSATSLEETCCGVSKGEETAASEPTVLNRCLPLPAFPISTSLASKCTMPHLSIPHVIPDRCSAQLILDRIALLESIVA